MYLNYIAKGNVWGVVHVRLSTYTFGFWKKNYFNIDNVFIGLPGKLTTTNKQLQGEVDKELALNWSPPEVNSSDFQPATRMDEKTQPPAGSREMLQHGNTDKTHFKIADLK